MPSARKAASFTRHSTASASSRPSCRSVESRRRAPNRIVKAIIITTTIIPTLSTSHELPPGLPAVSAVKVVTTAFSCSAMYGMVPTSASRVASAASACDLP